MWLLCRMQISTAKPVGENKKQLFMLYIYLGILIYLLRSFKWIAASQKQKKTKQKKTSMPFKLDHVYVISEPYNGIKQQPMVARKLPQGGQVQTQNVSVKTPECINCQAAQAGQARFDWHLHQNQLHSTGMKSGRKKIFTSISEADQSF